MSNARDRIVFKKTYKRGAFIKPHQFPTVPTLKEGSEIKDCELIAEGEIERKGERQRFIELRIYAGPKQCLPQTSAEKHYDS